jgi:hypothetical protein
MSQIQNTFIDYRMREMLEITLFDSEGTDLLNFPLVIT